MNKKILGLALAATFSTGVVNAATYSEMFTVASQTTALTSTTATGNPAIGSFAQFDASFGTLTGVAIDITGFSESATVLENTAANAQTFNFSSTLDWLFEVLDGDDALDFGFTQALSSTGGFVTLASGGVLDLGTVNASDVYSTSISGAGLAAFIGASNVGIGCNTFSGSSLSGSTNIIASQSTTAGCSANITYTYDVAPTNNVPEPASLALLGLGLGLMGVARRNKKS